MLNKAKNIFYDISDVLVALTIIVVVSLIISWKTSDTLDYVKVASTNTPSTTDTTNSEESPIIIDPVITDSTLPEESDTNTAESEHTNTVTISEPVHITIPSGSSGFKIATILKDHQLIDTTNDFIVRVGERKLDTKLRSGDFKLSETSTLDEIINVLTGQS